MKYVIHVFMRLLESDQISHTQSMVAKRGLTNRANVHTSVKKFFKTQRGRNQIKSTRQLWLQLDIVSYQKKKKETI